MKLLDRYVIRNFLQVYLYCIAGFISIWLIFDVSDNISTFIDEHVGLLLVGRYYATQIPQVLIILLPVSLLLSLLFALGRMSRSNLPAHLVYSKFPSSEQHVQQRSGPSTGHERQYRYKLRGKSRFLPRGNQNLGFGECEGRSL